MILPVRIVARLFFLNFNLHLALPTHFVTGALSAVGASVCYTATGWLTGAAAVLAFNFVARRMGGIEASMLMKASRATGDSVNVLPRDPPLCLGRAPDCLD
jgi:hypothetical protein